MVQFTQGWRVEIPPGYLPNSFKLNPGQLSGSDKSADNAAPTPRYRFCFRRDPGKCAECGVPDPPTFRYHAGINYNPNSKNVKQPLRANPYASTPTHTFVCEPCCTQLGLVRSFESTYTTNADVTPPPPLSSEFQQPEQELDRSRDQPQDPNSDATDDGIVFSALSALTVRVRHDMPTSRVVHELYDATDSARPVATISWPSKQRPCTQTYVRHGTSLMRAYAVRDAAAT